MNRRRLSLCLTVILAVLFFGFTGAAYAVQNPVMNLFAAQNVIWHNQFDVSWDISVPLPTQIILAVGDGVEPASPPVAEGYPPPLGVTYYYLSPDTIGQTVTLDITARHTYYFTVWQLDGTSISAPSTVVVEVYAPPMVIGSLGYTLSAAHDSITLNWVNADEASRTAVCWETTQPAGYDLPTQAPLEGAGTWFNTANIDPTLTNYTFPVTPGMHLWTRVFRAGIGGSSTYAGFEVDIPDAPPAPVPPDPATGLGALWNAGASRCDVAWSNPATGGEATGTLVAATINIPGSTPPVGAMLLSGDATSTALALAPGTWYISVYKANEAGVSGPVYTQVVVPPPPPPPVQYFATSTTLRAPAYARVRRNFRLYGSVYPGAVGTARVYIWRKVNGRWRSMGYKTVAVNGSYSVYYRTRYAGYYRTRTRFLGGTVPGKVFYASWSQYRYTRVR